MTDEAFAEELIRRLNALLQDNEVVADAIERLASTIVRVCDPNKILADHPTIQVSHKGMYTSVGLIGLLNGLSGVRPDGWGYVSAQFGNGELVGFRKTVRPGDK